jgi:hypothetical protein
MGVNGLADEGGVLGGGNAHDQLLALGLGQQGVLQVIVVEELESSVDES